MVFLQTFFATHHFAEFATILAIVAIISYIMKLLKQPLLIGYIIAGIILGPTLLGWIHETEHIELFSDIGIAILLFMVGLGLNLKVVKDLGKASLIIGLGQIIFTTTIGVLIALLLSFTFVESIYIALALAFSSTIIIVKLLSDKGVLDELYGKISIGMLIVQDLVAMLILMILSSLPTGSVDANWLVFGGTIAVKAFVVIGFTYFAMKYLLPKLLKHISASQEFLLMFSLGRCLLYATGLEIIGFSLEIGALIAGITLASSPYKFEISSKMKPLRDFFIMVFFVFLGSQLQFGDISRYGIHILVFSLFVLLGNPLIVTFLMGRLGYQPKNSMMVGFTVAQISEFSFILITLAIAIGHITHPAISSMITVIGLITIAGSSYFFQYADAIYLKLKKYIALFTKKDHTIAYTTNIDPTGHDIIVFGNHRTGKGIVDMLLKNNKKFIIVDCDPQVIKKLQAKDVPCIYGDASDSEFLEDLQLQKAKMIVSTIHDFETNALILLKTKKIAHHLITILSANRLPDAEMLYEQGASYVLVPHIIGGHHTAMLIEQYEYDIEKYAEQKSKDYTLLAE